MGTHRSLAVAAACLGVAALAGCPTVDLGDTPTEIGLCNPAGGVAYFQDQIWPNYIRPNDAAKTCARTGCHSGGGTGLDYPLQVDYVAAFKRTQLYLNCGTPAASPFLTKPLAGIEAHSGGDIFASTDDPAVKIFLDWFM
jgi:predicted CxxxxCH...CXXCH cytochrome family protein